MLFFTISKFVIKYLKVTGPWPQLREKNTELTVQCLEISIQNRIKSIENILILLYSFKYECVHVVIELLTAKLNLKSLLLS